MKKAINVGAGSDIQKSDDEWQWTNVDHIQYANMDKLVDFEDKVDTLMFMKKHAGVYDKVLAKDFIEHFSDKVGIMTIINDLLKVGGLAEIKVPILNVQDPQHKSLWDLNSFLYFTKWSWYTRSQGWHGFFELVDWKKNTVQSEEGWDDVEMLHITLRKKSR